MSKEKLVATLKEKGPAFFVGAIVGAALITAFINREKIVTTIKRAIGNNQQNGIQNGRA